MIKHFEHLWEEAEVVVSNFYESKSEDNMIVDFTSLTSANNLLKKLTSSGNKEDQYECMGDLITFLCFYSKKYDINSYAALKDSINNMKIDMLDEDD